MSAVFHRRVPLGSQIVTAIAKYVMVWIFVCGTLGGEGGTSLSAEPALSRYEFTEPQMGVPFKVILYAADEATANLAARSAFARIAELNAIFSDYDRTSELSQLFAASPTPEPVRVSDDLWKVLKLAQNISEKSNGAFDFTVGPYVGLWRRAKRHGEFPTPEQLDRAKKSVGYQNVELFEAERAVKLTKPHMRLDLGGIAAGYAVDEALDVLASHGIRRALIDASGDIGVRDPPPGRAGWRIGIAKIDSADGPPSRYVELANMAVSTSGDLFQYFYFDGVRYSHIVDPQTGLGLTHRVSATVIARDCVTADFLATAASVLGPQSSATLAKSFPGSEVLLITQEGDETTEHATPGFDRFDVEKPAP